MAIVRRQMTPEQWALTVKDISRRLRHTKPVIRKFGITWQKSLKRNIGRGVNANNKKMAPLSQATLESNIVDDSDDVEIGERARFGNKPMKATGRMQKGLKYLLIKNGLILLNEDRQRQNVSGVHTKDWSKTVTFKMQRHLAGLHNIFVKVGTVLFRPARIPFALNSRKVKRSVRELNKFIFKKLFQSE